VDVTDGVQVEILEEIKQTKFPIQHHHLHYSVPTEARPEIQAWYVKVFGAKAVMRGTNIAAEIPGANLTFGNRFGEWATTKGRALDHIGFDVTNLEAFCKRLEAAGIKLDQPYTKNPKTGAARAFLYDPWGTYIELNERPNPL
jgi:catechol 2,3-dioxygenase-like lactoylglutathione lyase family enzyme